LYISKQRFFFIVSSLLKYLFTLSQALSSDDLFTSSLVNVIPKVILEAYQLDAYDCPVAYSVVAIQLYDVLALCGAVVPFIFFVSYFFS
jgi:hypothetical protein